MTQPPPTGFFWEGWTQSVRAKLDKLVDDLKADGRRIQRQGAALGDAVANRLTPLARAAAATPRAARLATEGGLLVAAYRWHDLRTRGLTPEAERAQRQALDRRTGERLFHIGVELRGAVLKLGQFASTRRDLLPPAIAEELARLQDDVPPVPYEAIAARIQDELGAPVETLFATFDPTPLAAASLAQVHAATLPDGTPVAVKVQVPGVEDEVEGDLSLFAILARALADHATTLDLPAIAEELGRSVREELDYRLEAERARRIADDFAHDPTILVPRIHEKLSTQRVLTMDRIDGERLTTFLERTRREPGGDQARDAILATLIRTTAHQILQTGRFQADPHPGNFLVAPPTEPAAPAHRLALLDFGSIRELQPDHRRAYAALTRAVIARDRVGAADLMTELGFEIRPGGDPEVLHDFADLLLDAFRPEPDRPLSDLDPRAAFDRALALGQSTPVRIPSHFVQIGRVLAALAGLLLTHRPNIALWPLIAPHLAP